VDHRAIGQEEARILRELLAEERERLVRQEAALDDTYRGLVDAADLEPPDDEHDPDGTTAYERAQIGPLLRASRLRLDDVDAAIDGLERGTYGMCIRCGEPIPFDRLVAVLSTTTCVACASH